MFNIFTVPGLDGKDMRFWRILLVLSLGLHIVAGFTSLGFFHYDEHYQILEFAGMKMGYTSPGDLPWEYPAQIRPTLQPYLALGMLQLVKTFIGDDPFIAAFWLRILSGILGWFTSFLLLKALMPSLKDRLVRRAAITLTTLAGLLLFVHARFSSETWSGAMFFIGLAVLMLHAGEGGSFRNFRNMGIACLTGLLFGLAFVFRFQSALFLPGLFLWLLVMGRMPFRYLLYIGMAALVGIGIGFISDRFFYGNWVNTAFRYYIINIKEGKAASFGVEPWYWYLKGINDTSFPFNILLILSWVTVFVHRPKSIFTWTLLPFILAHFAIGHKEMRFLFPLVFAIPLMAALAIEPLAQFARNRQKYAFFRWPVIGLGCLWIVLNVLQYGDSLRNLRSYVRPLHYVYHAYPDQPVALLVADKYAYGELTGLTMNYYRRSETQLIPVDSAGRWTRILQAQTAKPVLLMVQGKGAGIPEMFAPIASRLKEEYSVYPEWTHSFNYTGWLDRTTHWKVYRYVGDREQPGNTKEAMSGQPRRDKVLDGKKVNS